MLVRLLIITMAFCFALKLSAQENDTSSLQQLPIKFLEQVSSRANKLEQKLDEKSSKAIAKLEKQEAKIRRKLAKIDSIAANNLLVNAMSRYKQLEEKLKNPGKLTHYIPRLDSLVTSFKFLENSPEIFSSVKEAGNKIKEGLSKLKDLETQLRKAEDIKQFLRERKQFLKEQLSKFGFARELKKINKQVYYYSQQINEYKSILSDPEKIEKKVIELLSQTKIFRDFMRRNSMLASFFPMPGGSGISPGGQAGFAGLQTRVQLTSFIQQAGMTTTGTSVLQGNIQDVQSQVAQLSDRISRVTGGGEDLEMPDFKVNSQKTKGFFKRLEIGTNLQSQRASGYFPSTSDWGLSVGYKLNDKSIIGVGTSYKLGLGTGWNNIRFSHQGMGLRSFIDWKLKGSIWVTGGYEKNFRTSPLAPLPNGETNVSQESGLIGLTKTVSLKSKLLKKTKLQVLFDFLSYRQQPRSQPLVFRLGYSFK